MIFVSSPYSHESARVMEKRFLLTEAFVVHCVKNLGLITFSPIVYMHKMAEINKLPTDAAFYHNFNMDMLRKCETMFELHIDGWKSSKGMEAERRVARILNIPTMLFDEKFDQIIDVQAEPQVQ